VCEPGAGFDVHEDRLRSDQRAIERGLDDERIVENAP
jgi:hypothetical protein